MYQHITKKMILSLVFVAARFAYGFADVGFLKIADVFKQAVKRCADDVEGVGFCPHVVCLCKAMKRRSVGFVEIDRAFDCQAHVGKEPAGDIDIAFFHRFSLLSGRRSNRRPQNQMHGLFGFACRADDEALVVF